MNLGLALATLNCRPGVSYVHSVLSSWNISSAVFKYLSKLSLCSVHPLTRYSQEATSLPTSELLVLFISLSLSLLVLCIDQLDHFHWTLGSLRAETSFNHYSIIICTFYTSLIKCHCSVKARFNSVENTLLMICKMTKYIT